MVLNKPAPLIHAVLFDLDGTLLDTAPDLVSALNRLLKANGKAAIHPDSARNIVSQGSVALTRFAFPEITEPAEFEKLRRQFLRYYADAICRQTAMFAGMAELLAALEGQHIPWGIVTNKPGWLSEPLLEQLSLRPRAACLVSGDTLERRKPHPDPLLLASQTINLPAHAIVYVGDDPRDIYAGNAAGMYTCVARYGYIDKDIDTRLWGADFIIHRPQDLLDHIQLSASGYAMAT